MALVLSSSGIVLFMAPIVSAVIAPFRARLTKKEEVKENVE